jgi:hypothetical protein
MDEKTSELMGQLKDEMSGVSAGQITEIIREAREEAVAEAKAIIKDVMLRSILKRALSNLEGVGWSAVLAGEAVTGSTETFALSSAKALAQVPAEPLETAQAQDVAESKEQIWQEIEAIRQKIAENERSLGRGKASSAQGEAAPAAGEGGGALLDALPAEEGEAGCIYYVYGVVGDGGQSLEGLPGEGIDPAYPVYALPYEAELVLGDPDSHPVATASGETRGGVPLHRTGRSTDQTLQAIVSQVSLCDFGQERLEENLDDLRWLEARVRSHQDILDTVVAGHTLIPMRFCTLYRTEERIREMLEQHHTDFVQALTRLEGKREWGVRVYCDNKVLAQRAGQVSDRVNEIEAEMAAKSSGAAYFMKKKLEETIAAEVERISDEFAQRSHDRLSSRAAEAIISPLQGKELTGRQEAMLLNGAYLVAEEQLAAFRAELASLQDEYGALGLGYEMTGPWPAYNFSTIDLTDSETNCVEEGVAHE